VWLAEIYAGFFASFVAHVMNSWAVSGPSDIIPTHYVVSAARYTGY
jgi:hypothetical protein